MAPRPVTVDLADLVVDCPVEHIAHDNDVRPGRIDVCPLLHESRSRPSIVGYDDRSTSKPNRHKRVFVVVPPFLERDPGLDLWYDQMIPDDGQRKWARRRGAPWEI